MNTTATTDTLTHDIFAACYLKGNFMLRSGRQATHYFDKYQLESSPELLRRVTDRLVTLIPSNTEVLAGLEMGGIPVVTMLSQVSGIPAAFIRKTKKEHGTAKLAEGADLNSKNVTIVEDIVTSGGQIILSAADIRALGATVGHALCVIDRQEGGSEALKSHGIRLTALFTAEDIAPSETGKNDGQKE
jgi:orotate phosphoribosyltransferase